MVKKLTTEIFIEKAKEIYGNLYDYSQVLYKNNSTKIKIICSEHGIFEQIPSNHLFYKGCKQCSNKKSSNEKTETKKEFVEKAIKIHGEKYDYSLVEYKKSNIKIVIKCLIHGIFKQTPNSHLRGQGCHQCGIIKLSKLFSKNKNDFIIDAINIHKSELYDYSLVDYINDRTKVKIKCNKQNHGIFEQTPNNHLAGKGCPKCKGEKISNKKINSKEEFIEKAVKIHKNLYDYSLVEYKRSNIKIDIFCNNCEKFFKQIPNSHLQGRGCPKCSHGNISKIETKYLDYFGIPNQNRNIPVYIENQKFIPDAIDQKNKIIWEFLGDLWHGNPDKFNPNNKNPFTDELFKNLYHKTIDRLKFFRENGYKVIYIWENEFDNLLLYDKGKFHEIFDRNIC